MGKTILAVDDEADILVIIEHHLQKNGYDVIRAETGEKAVELARERKPDLILLDLMLPETV
jgi:DNA-binding response OmpR family regulator